MAMNNFQNVYDTHEYHDEKDLLQFYFVSKGDKDIVKVVQYQYVKDFDGRPLFNLGFDDYEMESGVVSDEEVSNNKDHYKVLHTVLNTVPRFFDACGDIILMAQGSDSKQEYIDKCRTSCSKKCGVGLCKNAHRRISIYRGFVDKYFEELSESYIFKGGEGVENQNLIEPYQKGKKYNAVLVIRKNS
jgi:hypothetical protein